MILRVDKFLSQCKIATRSEIKKMVKAGRIAVNGEIIKKAELKIDSDTDEVFVDNKKINYEPFVYYMLNKPAGVVSATNDNVHKCVNDLLDEKKEIFPVGRLDIDTEGLLIMTNDGELSHKLLSPGKHVDKTYFVRVDKSIPQELVSEFKKGVDIKEKNLTKPAVLNVLEDENSAYITICEGKFHQIKRMFLAFGLEVTFLKRLSMGGLNLDKNLNPGEYRRLTKEEISLLKGEIDE
ncbi:16S rRNA pseudouridine516 synthase [Acetitomaculum ruminis DSM 5522]|uniref:Pseudouridine synthase n=1 Tax=Acetitomaculum ruminis DSM 5522 TaxID=1120918 RepID=A0A1I0V947_9FIRM|nr:pseudouridine synthase [Acetitomaculum ruminis]SFA72909.1 16S rRNA pseudouridine516 synthase [Acetitomaculum ruminis DSM 5522]